jgi:hypothetical protein
MEQMSLLTGFCCTFQDVLQAATAACDRGCFTGGSADVELPVALPKTPKSTKAATVSGLSD